MSSARRCGRARRLQPALELRGILPNARAKSVLTRPGAHAVDAILCLPHSTARLRASWKSAALEMP